jgi:hypothetical protein
VNLGAVINTSTDERFAKISNDKKYLFFGQFNNNNFDIYWVDIKVIANLITNKNLDSSVNRNGLLKQTYSDKTFRLHSSSIINFGSLTCFLNNN